MQSAQSIDRAIWLNRLALIGYIGSLVIVAILTFLSWWAGSHLQDTIQKDADARIAEADSKAAVANENAGKANERAGTANEAAGRANERAEKLESENLTLRGQVAALETAASEAKTQLVEQQGRTAILEKAASDARAEMARQQERAAKLERLAFEARTELARQQARAAEAEKQLEEVKRRQQPRKFFPSREVQDLLANSAKADLVEISYPQDDGEAARLGQEILFMLRWAKWTIGNIWPYTAAGYEDRGEDVTIVTKRSSASIFRIEGSPLATLVRVLESEHLKVGYDSDPTLPSDNSFRLVVSRK